MIRIFIIFVIFLVKDKHNLLLFKRHKHIYIYIILIEFKIFIKKHCLKFVCASIVKKASIQTRNDHLNANSD